MLLQLTRPPLRRATIPPELLPNLVAGAPFFGLYRVRLADGLFAQLEPGPQDQRLRTRIMTLQSLFVRASDVPFTCPILLSTPLRKATNFVVNSLSLLSATKYCAEDCESFTVVCHVLPYKISLESLEHREEVQPWSLTHPNGWCRVWEVIIQHELVPVYSFSLLHERWWPAPLYNTKPHVSS